MVTGQTTFTYGEGTVTKAFKNMIAYNMYGVDVAKKWVEQRIRNEATALQFIKENTAIPVPAVYDVGEGKDGYYLMMEFFNGLPLDEMGRQMPHAIDIWPHGQELQTMPAACGSKRCDVCAGGVIPGTRPPEINPNRPSRDHHPATLDNRE